ncbi:hypothetical protein TNCV_1492391 [Trichonephila clavipes]|nr:hypothetical protein TNCV_1492391 [Trichonephila clavipes]
MLIQPASNQLRLVRGTDVLLEIAGKLHYRADIRTAQTDVGNLKGEGLLALAKEDFPYRAIGARAAKPLFHSDPSLEAVDRRTPNNSKTRSGRREGDVSARRSTLTV